VGSTKSIKIDVRVLAATAGDLENLVDQAKFREDLFYRLDVVRVRIPPLRDRREDIDQLCHHFVKKFNSQFDSQVKGFTKEALGLLRRYDWPGNVRELENVVQRGMVTTPGDQIETSHLPRGLRIEGVLEKGRDSDEKGSASLSLKQAQRHMEREMIARALAVTSGNKSQAARMLEISYPSLLHKIKEYDI
jgi:two-component system response regulator AtoC